MKITNHRLILENDQPVDYVPSPNRGGPIEAHDFLVLHYTAGRNFETSVDWLTRRCAKASAHIVIGRAGEITQLVPFNRVAWHAGRSQWQHRTGLNRYSIGIELDNGGRLTRQGDQWVTWFGRPIPDETVILAPHTLDLVDAPHTLDLVECGWHAYTEAQISSAVEVVGALVEKYQLLEIIGHADIAPLRKCDPGPAFPFDQFRSMVFGRREMDDDSMRCSTGLNIRRGPGTQYGKLDEGPLPMGTQVLIRKSSGAWRFVDVLDCINGDMDLQGWVHGRYLHP